jgi:putative ABC transport system substrate-binding protein
LKTFYARIYATFDNTNEIAQTITSLAGQRGTGLVVLPSPITNGNYGLIAELAARHRLPAIYPYRFFVSSGGGLVSYGAIPSTGTARRLLTSLVS